MKLIKICLSLLITISMISIDLVNALNDDFEYELLDNGTIEIQGYDGEDTSITVPSKIDGISVTSIGEDAFYCCDTLTTIKIPNGIKSIGSSAFSDCTSLESISIPKSVTSIGDFAFYNCSSLISIKIPEKIKCILEYTFSECSSLESVTISNSVTHIEEGAFDCCSSLKNITIPNSVTKLGDYAFNECTDLKEIIIPESVTSIGEYAFSDCEGLIDITILGNIKSISDYTFSGCTSLKNITIPDGVANIGESAFSGCESLVDVTILGNIKNIQDYTFSDCTSLQNITIPDDVENIGEGAFDSCSNLASLIIPKSVTSIGEDVFNGCTQLTLKVYPNSYGLKYAKENSIPYEIITVPASTVQIDKTSLSLHTGESSILVATITPNDVTDKVLVWTSSDSNIVKVDSNGKVIALSKGEAIITVKTSNGKEAQCSITVVDSIVNIPITSISLNQTILTLDKGNTYTLIADIHPSDTTDSKVLSWHSSDSNIVEVDSKGRITALSTGQANITVKTNHGLIAICIVTVKDSEINRSEDEENSKSHSLIHKDKEIVPVIKNVKTEDTTNIMIWLEIIIGSLIIFIYINKVRKAN